MRIDHYIYLEGDYEVYDLIFEYWPEFKVTEVFLRCENRGADFNTRCENVVIKSVIMVDGFEYGFKQIVNRIVWDDLGFDRVKIFTKRADEYLIRHMLEHSEIVLHDSTGLVNGARV